MNSSTMAIAFKAWAATFIIVTSFIGCNDPIRKPETSRRSTAVDSLLSKKPFTLGMVEHFEDGGSISGVLLAANGDTVRFCLDGRIPLIDDFKNLKQVFVTRAPREVYIGKRYVEDAGALRLPAGSREEREFLRVLQQAVDREMSRSDQDKLCGQRHWSGAQQRACLALQVIKLRGA